MSVNCVRSRASSFHKLGSLGKPENIPTLESCSDPDQQLASRIGVPIVSSNEEEVGRDSLGG
jgi:hypothetical protein